MTWKTFQEKRIGKRRIKDESEQMRAQRAQMITGNQNCEGPIADGRCLFTAVSASTKPV